MKSFNFATLLALALPLSGVAAAGHHARGHHARHTDIARRVDGEMQVFKRTSNSRWTFYDVGLGACGKNNVESDFIVALNSAQFGGGYPGPNCFKTITMQYNGKTTQAQIMDECPGCPYGGLDLSRGLFRFFDSESKGVLTGSWWFGGEGGPAPPPPSKPTKKPAPPPPPPSPTHEAPKTTPRPEPTTTKAPEKPTTHEESTTKASTPSSSKASASASSSAGASASHGSGSASVPVATGSVQDSQNLGSINLALIGLGGLAVAGVQAQ